MLGYWGSADSPTARRQLQSMAGSDRLYPASPLEGADWGVACDSSSRIQTDVRGWTVELSASGIPDACHAWARGCSDRLVLGREPFGHVPLYWMEVDGAIWFAAYLRSLLPLLARQQISLPGLYGYSCFSYVPTPLTPVAGIQAVAAGVEISFVKQQPDDRSGYAIHAAAIYEWRESPDKIADEATATAQLRTLLEQAIGRTIADLDPTLPVGVFLSGGLDSSIVASLLVRAGMRVRAYTLDMGLVEGVTGFSELPYAEQVAAHLEIPLVKVDARAPQFRTAIAATARALDLPFGDGVAVPKFLLSRAASQEVAVVFNGEGGDQLFGGWTNKPLIAAGIYHTTQPNFYRDYLHTFHRLWGAESQVFVPEIAAGLQTLDPTDWIAHALAAEQAPSLLHRLRRANLMLKGAQNIHPLAANLARACGLSVRSPFCDRDLATWTFHLPGEFCLQGAREKYLLKRAVENWLPSEIVWRDKRGMGVPLTALCLRSLWKEVGFWLHPDRLGHEGFFQADLVWRIVTGEFSGQIRGRRVGEILWLLIAWQVWCREVLGVTDPPRSPFHPFWFPAGVWKWWAGISTLP